MNSVGSILSAVFKDSVAEPVVEGYGRYGDFELVGHSQVTNEHCGEHKGYFGCLNVKGHDRIGSDGLNHKGQVFIRGVFKSCDKPSCPICYKYGWATREASKMEMRLVEASRQFGLVEHIICSVPRRDYGLSYEELRVKAVKVLVSRGVHGGVLIFHGFRYNDYAKACRKNVSVGWYLSFHWHVLGFIKGGYVCRGCVKGCGGCGGFEAIVRRLREVDGYVVKVAEDLEGVKGVRKTIFGTARYQLDHASIKVGVARFHVATWFGVCSYRRLKVFPEKRRSLCPLCSNELVRVCFCGNPFVMNLHISSKERFFWEEAVDELGRKNWKVDTNRVW
jgi:hypothetical protein